MEKLGATTRVQAVAIALRESYISWKGVALTRRGPDTVGSSDISEFWLAEEPNAVRAMTGMT